MNSTTLQREPLHQHHVREMLGKICTNIRRMLEAPLHSLRTRVRALCLRYSGVRAGRCSSIRSAENQDNGDDPFCFEHRCNCQHQQDVGNRAEDGIEPVQRRRSCRRSSPRTPSTVPTAALPRWRPRSRRGLKLRALITLLEDVAPHLSAPNGEMFDTLLVNLRARAVAVRPNCLRSSAITSASGSTTFDAGVNLTGRLAKLAFQFDDHIAQRIAVVDHLRLRGAAVDSRSAVLRAWRQIGRGFVAVLNRVGGAQLIATSRSSPSPPAPQTRPATTTGTGSRRPSKRSRYGHRAGVSRLATRDRGAGRRAGRRGIIAAVVMVPSLFQFYTRVDCLVEQIRRQIGEHRGQRHVNRDRLDDREVRALNRQNHLAADARHREESLNQEQARPTRPGSWIIRLVMIGIERCVARARTSRGSPERPFGTGRTHVVLVHLVEQEGAVRRMLGASDTTSAIRIRQRRKLEQVFAEVVAALHREQPHL